MTENVESLILEPLRRMDDRLSNIEGGMHDIKLRMTVAEEHLGNMVLGISGVNARIDRLSERVDRIDRRLELSDHQ